MAGPKPAALPLGDTPIKYLKGSGIIMFLIVLVNRDDEGMGIESPV